MRHATQRRFSVVRFFQQRKKILQEGNIQKRRQTELKEKKEWKAVGRNEWNENQRRKHKLVRVCVCLVWLPLLLRTLLWCVLAAQARDHPNPSSPQGVSAAAKMFCTTHFVFRHLYSIGSTCIFIGSHGRRGRCDFTTLMLTSPWQNTETDCFTNTSSGCKRCLAHTSAPFHTQDITIIYFIIPKKKKKKLQQFPNNMIILFRWILLNTFWDELGFRSCAIWIRGMC